MTTASTKAFEKIRGMILEGRFAQGERLRESELTALCGVSRTPVREALRRLAIGGLVVFTPHHGARVADVDLGELEEIYALRAMIEAHAARRAATRITPEALARLKTLATEMEGATASRHPERVGRFFAANQEFHRIILDAAMSRRLSAMAALVIETPLTMRTLVRYSTEELDRSMRHHRELIAAFEARNGDWAASVMRSHVHAASHAVMRGQGAQAEPPAARPLPVPPDAARAAPPRLAQRG